MRHWNAHSANKEQVFSGHVFGVDIDMQVLEMAGAKARKANVDVRFDSGTALKLPYADNSYGRVFLSLVLHHLDDEDKERALIEAIRVLKPSGELNIADFGKPHNLLMRLISLAVGRLEKASANVKGLLPTMMKKVGLVRVEETARFMTIFGTISLYKASNHVLNLREVRK